MSDCHSCLHIKIKEHEVFIYENLRKQLGLSNAYITASSRKIFFILQNQNFFLLLYILKLHQFACLWFLQKFKLCFQHLLHALPRFLDWCPPSLNWFYETQTYVYIFSHLYFDLIFLIWFYYFSRLLLVCIFRWCVLDIIKILPISVNKISLKQCMCFRHSDWNIILYWTRGIVLRRHLCC